MVSYPCPKCNAIFNKISNYKRHLNKKNDCGIKNDILDDIMVLSTNKQDYAEPYAKLCQNKHLEPSNIKYEDNNDNLICQYCLKKYSSKSTLTRHLKDNCKIKKQKDIERENKLKVLLEKDKLKENEINELKKQNQLILIQNKKLNDKFNKLNKNDSNNNQITKIHNTIKKLETSIPANTNLSFSSQLVEQLIQKDKQLEEFIIQKK